MAEWQNCTMLQDEIYDDPSQLSQLLRQRAGSQFAIHSFTSTDLHHDDATSTLPSQWLPSPSRAATALPPSPSPTRATTRRVRFTSRHATPHLQKHHSAPVSTGERLTGKENTRKPHQSFDGAMDAPGDTQVDPEISKILTSGLYPDGSVFGAAFHPVVPAAEDISSESARNSVGVSSQEPPRDRNASPITVVDDHDTQPRAQYAATSPLKFETPAPHPSRVQDSQGHVLSSLAKTDRTPGTGLSASAFFSFGNAEEGKGMSLTQAFNATQAKTSPAIANLNDDVVFQRPSPNFTHTRHSSADGMVSSPTKVQPRKGSVMDVVMRSSSEPRADYESMKHSQERRSRGRAGEVEGQQDSWEQPTDVGRHYASRKAKRRLEQEAAKSLAGVSAPTSSALYPKTRGMLSMSTTIDSPEQISRTESSRYHGPYEGAGADAPYELSQALPGDDNAAHSPEETSQEDFNRRSAPAITKPVAWTEQGVQVPHTSSHPTHTYSGIPSRDPSQPDPTQSQPQPASQIRAAASQLTSKLLSRLRSSRETEVVMDSQPDSVGSFGCSQPAPLRFPSSPSTNQYSINQTTMLPKSALVSSPVSSAVPLPPKFTSQEPDMAIRRDDEADALEPGVPSSPPLLPQDGDIIYDEHAYEDDLDAEQRDDARSGEEGVDINTADDDDELPTPQDQVSTPAETGIHGEAEEEDHVGGTHNDDEVPETIDQEDDQDVSIRSSHPEDGRDESATASMDAPGISRQRNVPDTDAFEDTQLSLLPGVLDNDTQLEDGKDLAEVASAGIWNDGQHGRSGQNHCESNSNEHFDTEKDHTTVVETAHEINSTMERSGTALSPARFEGRSLLDIANDPGTQHSVDLDAIDLPQLSFDDNPDDLLDALMTRDSPFHPQKKRRTTYSTRKTYRSPIKETDPASDPLSSPAHLGVSYPTGWSPPTTQDQEVRGAQAASRARAEPGATRSATLKSKMQLKRNEPQTPRKGALKSVNKALLSKSPSRTPLQQTYQNQMADDTTPTKASQTPNGDVEMHDAERLDVEEPLPNVNIPSIEIAEAATANEFVEDPSGEADVPDRVFAFWPGIGYCPATCIGKLDSHRLRVRYDDGTLNSLEHMQIRALDLHPTDQIKIDIPGMKKSIYLVVGFKDKVDLEDPSLEYPATTRHGYATVVLEEKQRESLPANAQAQPKERIDVPVANIYLTTQLWARLKDRTFRFKPAGSPATSVSRQGSPRTVDSPIPVSTALRRSTAGPSLLRASTARASSVASSVRSNNNVFLNMAFAVTSTRTDINKDDISKLITSSGGLIVDEGFHQLFDTDSYNAPTSSSDSTDAPSSSMHGLKLKRKHEELHFVALIAQSHSRSPKFLQALSLNIPCLHLRWVHDSLAAGYALPFARYLLPAGTSTFLDPAGVVRSRDMHTYDPTGDTVSFAQMVKGRQLLFSDESVLIVSEENEQEPYIFLTHAMGATEVCLCSDLEEAKDLVDTGAWDWVYVDGKPDALADAAAHIFDNGGNKAARKKTTKKRKRDSESARADVQTLVRTGLVGEKKVKVACGEYVIQSLILGALMEE